MFGHIVLLLLATQARAGPVSVDYGSFDFGSLVSDLREQVGGKST